MLRCPDRYHLRPLSTIPSSRSCSKKEHRTLCAYLRTAAAAGGTYVRPPAAPPLDFPLTDSALYDSRRRPPGGRRPRRGIPSRGRSIPPPFQPQSGPFCRNLLSQLRREKHRYMHKKHTIFRQYRSYKRSCEAARRPRDAGQRSCEKRHAAPLRHSPRAKKRHGGRARAGAGGRPNASPSAGRGPRGAMAGGGAGGCWRPNGPSAGTAGAGGGGGPPAKRGNA